jgi:hypothetical protein
MSCYLCAYKRPESPRSHQRLPAGSPAGANDGLGSCWKCSVWACSTHGSLYGKFECAICTPAVATASALVANSVSGAAASRVTYAGERCNSGLRTRVASAVLAVVRDSSRRQDVDARALAAPATGTPNLVTNLADSIRAHEPALARGLVRATWADGNIPGQGFTSLDAIGGAVREQFAGVALAEPNDAAVTIAAGALLMGYALADDATEARRGDDGEGGWSQIESLPPPWQVTHPILLDPALWMLGTALQEG